MKPLVHAKLSVKQYGGKITDYIDIHNFFDSSKACVPDMRHRAILHNAFGIFLAERLFGVAITNSDGKEISVRDIGESHVLEDLGFIPTVECWLKEMEIKPWMTGTQKKIKKVASFKKNEGLYRVVQYTHDGAKLVHREHLSLRAADEYTRYLQSIDNFNYGVEKETLLN